LAIDISVQICTFNRRDLLVKALEALFRQDYPPDAFEIVLVDDGSGDGTGEAVKALNPPCALNYLYQENAGLATARNKGIRAARGEIVLFVDDDIMASESLLSEHVKTHRAHPKSVVRGWVNHVEDLENADRKIPRFTMQDISTAFFWTSNVSVARKHLEEAGMFDETFREYGWEDLELGLRLRALDLKLQYNKEAVVFHYKSRWKKSDLPRLLKQARSKGRTAVQFLDKHPTMRVKMATGINPASFLWNDLKEMGGLGKRFCQGVLRKTDDNELSGLPLFCAHQLYKFAYYKAIKDSLEGREAGAEHPDGAGVK
jgi:glycosyltransferase involved in cell wall biosynthesis